MALATQEEGPMQGQGYDRSEYKAKNPNLSEDVLMELKGELATLIETIRPDLTPDKVIQAVDFICDNAPAPDLGEGVDKPVEEEMEGDGRMVEEREVMVGSPADMSRMEQARPQVQEEDPRMAMAMGGMMG